MWDYFRKFLQEHHAHGRDKLDGYTLTNFDELSLDDFFKRVILVEVNSSAVARASRYLLDALGYSRATEPDKRNYDQLISNLRSDDDQLKQVTLSRIRDVP